jgi:diacylglycerol kinase family enzyme
LPLTARAYVNPRSGGLRHRDPHVLAAGIATALDDAGWRLEDCRIDVEVGPSLDALLAEPAPDLLVVAAGDGTVRSAARRLLGRDTALAVLPGGTFNLLARDLDVPRDIDAALAVLAGGPASLVDVAEVNGRLFLSAVALGLGADACALREQIRGTAPLDWPETVFDAARRFAGGRPLQLRALGGELALTFRSQAVFVANGPFRRHGLMLMRRDGLESGRLALYAQRDPSRWAALMTLARARLGGFAETEIIDEDLTELRLETRPPDVLATIDGEMRTLRSPLQFSLRPRALRVRRPATAYPPLPPERPVASWLRGGGESSKEPPRDAEARAGRNGDAGPG